MRLVGNPKPTPKLKGVLFRHHGMVTKLIEVKGVLAILTHGPTLSLRMQDGEVKSYNGVSSLTVWDIERVA